jgi:ElaB/YqjD/DUF883 family membrane-anchored ribosome-binding protein
MTTSAQLERETEQTRSELARTLDELRVRITPGQLVDDAVDYAKNSGGGEFVRNLGRQAKANPMPVALIGAGLAWLMMSSDRQQPSKAGPISRAAETAVERVRQSVTGAVEQVGELGQEAAEQTREVGSDWMSDASDRITDVRERFRAAKTSAEQSSQSASSRAGETISSFSDHASSAYETAKSRTSETYGRMADQGAQATSAISRLGQRTAGASRDLLQFCRTQPLVLAGLGMALGAIIGALIPPTETEDRLFGETSDQVKDQARNVAQDQIQRASSAAETGVNEAADQFSSDRTGGQPGVAAETSLVPEVENSDEPAEQMK